MTCFRCDAALDSIDIGAYRKLVDKCAPRYLCRDCLAADLGWTREYLDRVVLQYRERGCLLFPSL